MFWIAMDLTLDEETLLIQTLNEHRDVFAWSYKDLKGVDPYICQHTIPMREDAKPCKQRPYTYNENLANKILEEKTEKFTALNQNNLKTILEPFQEKITDLKNRVNEAYEKENKERFSLAEKVKELAELNQQISDDAKKLTRALKGESKTQGNWGEMILESILEKSGLVKGREYFRHRSILPILPIGREKSSFNESSGQ